VTEELWGRLKRAAQVRSEHLAPAGGWEEALIVARWPQAEAEESWEASAVEDFSLIMEMVRSIRNARAEKKVTPGKLIPATIAAGGRIGIIGEQLASIIALAHLDRAETRLVESLAEKPANAIGLVVSGVEIYLPLTGMVDNRAERARMEKELAEVESQIERLKMLLNGPFAEKAPEPVVEKERQRLAAFMETAEKLKGQIKSLSSKTHIL
jgi:valyl-tRNA synthetase